MRREAFYEDRALVDRRAYLFERQNEENARDGSDRRAANAGRVPQRTIGFVVAERRFDGLAGCDFRGVRLRGCCETQRAEMEVAARDCGLQHERRKEQPHGR